MIGTATDLLAQFGGIAVGGASLLSLGLWLRRAQKVATWIRMGAVVAISTGLGAIAGVVDLGRLMEILTIAWELLPISLVAAGGGA